MVEAKIEIKNLNIFFGKTHALNNVSLNVLHNEILSIIGPSNSGKTSFLRSINRLNDLEEKINIDGSILLDGKDIYRQMNPEILRKRVGMILALPIPLPLSIYENIAYGPKMAGISKRSQIDVIVEEGLKSAYLW